MRSPFLTALLLLAACGDPGQSASGARGGSAGAEGPEPAASAARDPRLDAAREALGCGRLDVARTLLDQLGPGAGLERHLMEARAALLAGDAVATLRELERARAGWAGDPRVYGTAAEVFSALGRFESAADELELGLAIAGETPELQRARGVFLIAQAGGLEQGLAALEAALAADPELPYLERPLGQAYLLAGRQALGTGLYEVALTCARKSLTWDPLDPDARELLADALGELDQEDEALAVYEELRREGRPVEAAMAHLANQAAMRCLLVQDRERAITLWLRARSLGLPDDSMSTGANVLREEALDYVDRGIEHYGAEELVPAVEQFRVALELDPKNLEAENALGVALFKLGDYTAAAEAWRAVLDGAEAAGTQLPEPTHLNLARALVMGEREAEARGLLEEWLERHRAAGEWIEETEAMLERLSD